MTESTLFTIGSILLVSLVALSGIALLALSKKFLNRILLMLVGLSTGALLGGALLHLIPEALELVDVHEVSLLVLAGILISFVIERFLHFRHCHELGCSGHTKPVGTMILIGDSLHNAMDGILIASSYMVSIPLGITTTIAVLLHEIPQEIGDFAVLLHSGFSKKKAILFNFISALTAFIGAILALYLHSFAHEIELLIIPIAAGHFLYIAGSDLIPELHKETSLRRTAAQFICLLAGVGLMLAISGESHNHGGHEEIHDQNEIHHVHD